MIETRTHVIVTGKVQGVFFRMETKVAADRLGVFGWVRNKIDGTVEAVFEGNKKKVELILKWCKHGPPRSKVNALDIKWENYTGAYNDFEIRY